MRLGFFLLISLFLFSCASIPKGNYAIPTDLSAPDYNDLSSWAAHPDKQDEADKTPDPSLKNNQASAEIDVFFLHPTSYTKSKGNTNWNGAINDPILNLKTDKGAILNQASIFNGAGRVFAPRYRQAHLHAYTTKEKTAAKKAFELAYQDVKKAFEHYLENHNNGRPILLASHSQGTNHSAQLIKDYFDGKELQEKFVAAYLVGMPIPKDDFENISPCESAEETGCFISWQSYKSGHFSDWHQPNSNILSTNPLTWKTDGEYAPKELNKGAVLQKWKDGLWENLADAKNQDGQLWVTKPKFPGSFLITFKNYHVADYNFFYLNVRENAILRTEQFLKNFRKSNKSLQSN